MKTSGRVYAVGKLAMLIAIVTCAFASIPSITSPGLRQSAKALPCDAGEYRLFDFWLGDWDAFDRGNSAPSGRARVTRILEGCVLHEEYAGIDGHKGESFSIYDRTRNVWHQSWVTNRGELLVIEGTLQAGVMVLSGADRTAEGKDRLVRGMWKPEGDSVRETAVRSMDGGKTWQPWFDLVFRKHH